jgi:hypothetical protein
MPIVRGDLIGESHRLNLRTVDAQDFYAALVASVPDDFGRFRLSAPHITLRMYPRREPTPALLRRVERLLKQLGEGELPLWRSWEVDGVIFAELYAFKPTGNRYHRTPEPPGSEHAHQGACLSTAIHHARKWGQLDVAEALSRQLRALRDRGRTGPPPEPHREGAPPSPPSPPSQNDTPLTPRGAGGPRDEATRADVCTARRFERKRQLRDDADAVERYWIEAGGRPTAEERRRIREALREGRSVAELQQAVDAMCGRARILEGPNDVA